MKPLLSSPSAPLSQILSLRQLDRLRLFLAALLLLLSGCVREFIPDDKRDSPTEEPPPVVFGEDIETEVFHKYIVAIGFDVFFQRTVLTPGGPPFIAEPGEPSQGMGRLLPPMGDALDRIGMKL